MLISGFVAATAVSSHRVDSLGATARLLAALILTPRILRTIAGTKRLSAVDYQRWAYRAETGFVIGIALLPVFYATAILFPVSITVRAVIGVTLGVGLSAIWLFVMSQLSNRAAQAGSSVTEMVESRAGPGSVSLAAFVCFFCGTLIQFWRTL